MLNNEKKLVMMLAILGTQLWSTQVFAEDITYPGKPLAKAPYLNVANSLFSATDINNNNILVSGGAIGGYVYGGIGKDVDVSGNTVLMEGGSVYNIYGGYAYKSGNVSNNKIKITGGTINSIGPNGDTQIYGGYTGGGIVENNTVEITGGTVNGTGAVRVRGGFSDGGFGQAIGNYVLIDFNGSITEVFGGLSIGNVNNVAERNVVVLKSGDVTELTGGLGWGLAKNNIVNISGGKVLTNVYAGDSFFGSAIENSAYISGGTMDTLVGGMARGTNGEANSNTVEISGGSISTIIGGQSQKYNANYNLVVVNGLDNTADNVIGSYTGGADGTVEKNVVYINDGSMKTVVGGYGGKNLLGNAVVVNNGVINGDVAGAAAGNVNSIVQDNIVIVNGGEINGEVSGGQGKNIVKDNSIVINGGKITGTIIAGYAYGSGSGDVTGNSIIIDGVADLSQARLIGGRSTGSGKVDGNILRTHVKTEALSVEGFSGYYFSIDDKVNNNDTMLKITDTTQVSNLDNATVDIKIVGGKKFNNGDRLVLISSEGGLSTIDTVLGKGQIATNFARLINYGISVDGNDVVVDFGASSINPATRSLLGSRLAALNTLNHGADLAIYSLNEAILEPEAEKQYTMFANMDYGRETIKSDSDLSASSTSFVLGAHRKFNHKNSNLVFGGFIEGGRGSYNNSDNAIYSSGKNSYYGLGAIARNTMNNGLYLEGSLRFGRVSNDYGSANLDPGQFAKYDVGSMYYGVHIGIGKKIKLNATTNLDIYGKYLWTHQTAANTIMLDETIDFAALNSHRIRIGARVDSKGNGKSSVYAGLAYEYELGGRAGANIADMVEPVSGMRGGSALIEVGAIHKANSVFSMDLGLNAYMGKRQGLGGRASLKWTF